jgi:hypothetical protein
MDRIGLSAGFRNLVFSELVEGLSEGVATGVDGQLILFTEHRVDPGHYYMQMISNQVAS